MENGSFHTLLLEMKICKINLGSLLDLSVQQKVSIRMITPEKKKNLPMNTRNAHKDICQHSFYNSGKLNSLHVHPRGYDQMNYDVCLSG